MRASVCVCGSVLLQRVEVLIHRLPGNRGAQVTRHWPHGVARRINSGGVEHVTERLQHRNIHVRPRDPGLVVRIKQAFMQRTVGEGHTSFHAANVLHHSVTAAMFYSGVSIVL